MGGVRAYAIVFLPKSWSIIEKVIDRGSWRGGEFTSKMVMLKEKTMDLECKVQYLVAQLHDMKSSL